MYFHNVCGDTLTFSPNTQISKYVCVCIIPMKRIALLLGMSLMTAPAHADITHRMSSSVQLTVDAAATNVQRIGNTYSISGTNVSTSDGTTTGALGGLGTFTNGVASPANITASQATAGEQFSFTASYIAGDSVITTAPSVGAVSPFSNQTSTAAGSAGDLAGTIDSSGTIGLTAGGAGTSATGQFVSELTISR